MTPHGFIDTLRERNYILPELFEPRTHGHEINLHVLERNKACLRHCRRRKEISQVVSRKTITRIHAILPAT